MLAHYNFEQSDISAQIDDISTLNNHATNLGGILDTNSKYCRGFDASGQNTGSNYRQRVRSSLDLDDDVGTQGTISFWFNSNIAWDAGQERVLFDASVDGSGNGSSDKYFTLEISDNGRLRFSFEDSTDADFSFFEPALSGGTRLADTWYYVTATWDYGADTFELYVDGNLRTQSNHNTNGAMSGLGPIVLVIMPLLMCKQIITRWFTCFC